MFLDILILGSFQCKYDAVRSPYKAFGDAQVRLSPTINQTCCTKSAHRSPIPLRKCPLPYPHPSHWTTRRARRFHFQPLQEAFHYRRLQYCLSMVRQQPSSSSWVSISLLSLHMGRSLLHIIETDLANVKQVSDILSPNLPSLQQCSSHWPSKCSSSSLRRMVLQHQDSRILSPSIMAASNVPTSVASTREWRRRIVARTSASLRRCRRLRTPLAMISPPQACQFPATTVAQQTRRSRSVMLPTLRNQQLAPLVLLVARRLRKQLTTCSLTMSMT